MNFVTAQFTLPEGLLPWLERVASETDAEISDIVGSAIQTFLRMVENGAEVESGQKNPHGLVDSLEYVDGVPVRFGELNGEELLGLAWSYRKRGEYLAHYGDYLETLVNDLYGGCVTEPN